jgi:hypothetical protein
MGGRKKKLRASIAETEAVMASQRRDEAATKRTMSRYDNATVVAFARGSHLMKTAVTAVIATGPGSRAATALSRTRGSMQTLRSVEIGMRNVELAMSEYEWQGAYHHGVSRK